MIAVDSKSVDFHGSESAAAFCRLAAGKLAADTDLPAASNRRIAFRILHSLANHNYCYVD